MAAVRPRGLSAIPTALAALALGALFLFAATPAQAQTLTPSLTPTNFAALGGQNEISLRWDPPATGAARAAVTGYDIEVNKAEYSAILAGWLRLARVDAGTTTYRHDGLGAGQPRVYRLRATSATGVSPWVHTSAYTDLDGGDDDDDDGGDDDGGDDDDDDNDGGGGGGSPGGGGGARRTAPGAPTNLTADGGNEQVALSWEAPEDDGGSAITDYEYRIDGRGRWVSTGSTDTTHTVSGLDNDTVYTFEVRAVNRIGRSRASNRAEATPKAPVALNFAHFGNGNGITSTVVLVNVDSRPSRFAVYFYDTEGEPVDPASLVEVTDDLEVQEDGGLSVRAEMEPLDQMTIATHGRGELVTGSVKVVSDGSLGGLTRYSVHGVGVAGVGAGEPVHDVVFPARRQAGGIRTAAALHNLQEEALQVSCRLISGGAVLEEAGIPLEANGQTSWFLEEKFTATDTSDFLGSVRCTAPGRGMFTAIALEVDAARRIFTALPVTPVDRTGGEDKQTVLDFAHFVNGAGSTSELVFVNLSTEPSGPPRSLFHPVILASRPALYFYDTEGDPIAAAAVVDVTGDWEVQPDGSLTVRTEMEPLGQLAIATHGRGELLTGSVRVVSDGPIGGMLRYDLAGVGGGVVGASVPVSDALFPVRRQEGGITTGIAIHNLEASSELARCELRKEGLLLDTASIPLGPNGQTSWPLDRAFPGADTSDFAGAVRCTATGEGMFTAIALEMDPGNRTFITLPVAEIMSRE